MAISVVAKTSGKNDFKALLTSAERQKLLVLLVTIIITFPVHTYYLKPHFSSLTDELLLSSCLLTHSH